jgi:hypothetical protein
MRLAGIGGVFDIRARRRAALLSGYFSIAAMPEECRFWHDADMPKLPAHVRFRGVISTDRRNTF